jgi:hypothetical protein
MEEKKFKCDVSDNVIEYRCFKTLKQIQMDYVFMDEHLPKSFFVLLRTSIDQFVKDGYQTFVQSVSKEDWEAFLKSDEHWKIKEDTGYYLIIECNLDNAIGCISRGLGIDT